MALQLPPPTEAMIETLRALIRFVDEHGYAPTVRELGDLRGVNSTNGIAEQLRRLAMLGYLNMTLSGRARAIVITPAGRELAAKGAA